jgi:hypothetical protein
MGNKIAGLMGGMIETISTQYSLSTSFFSQWYRIGIG